MPLVGAAIGELIAHKDMFRAGKVGAATWFGMLIAIAVKLAVAFTMVGVFVAALLILSMASLFSPVAAIGWIALAAVYLAVLLGAALLRSVRGRDISLMVGLPAAWATVHVCWGAGFLVGLVAALAQRRGHD